MRTNGREPRHRYQANGDVCVHVAATSSGRARECLTRAGMQKCVCSGVLYAKDWSYPRGWNAGLKVGRHAGLKVGWVRRVEGGAGFVTVHVDARTY
jgi:hypothetical protein